MPTHPPSDDAAPAPRAASQGITDRFTSRLRSLSGLKSAVLAGRRVRERAIEKWLKIDTISPPGRRFDMATTFADPVPYEPVDYILLRKYMRPVKLRPDDVVFDIGCGMGRMLCLFSRCNIRKCIGIEYSAELADIARRNIALVRGRRAPAEVMTQDAIQADYSEGTVFWMFNPFGPQTMRSVLENIGESLVRRPRAIQLAYVNPLHEDVLSSFLWLRRTGQESSIFFKTYGASYWVGGG